MGSENGVELLMEFWKEKYLAEYVASGGSKIKFVMGKTGSGKSFCVRKLVEDAKELGYVTVSFSARNVWLHDFRSFYLEILKQCDIMQCLKGCRDRIIEGMGYRDELPEEMLLIDYMAQNNAADAINKREIRTQLKQMFLDNPRLDNNFALACSMLTGSLLGYPVLEKQNRELLLAWLHDDRTVKLQQLRGLGIFPGRITRYNARNMLRSLAEIIHIGGHAGLLVCVDDLDILINKSSLEELHYTKMKRDDTYESIRQLIDDIDNMHHVMFVYAYHRRLQDEENSGLKAYPALWNRIQSEVRGSRFNKFADIVDLDMLAQQEYTAEYIMELSDRMYSAIRGTSRRILSPEQASEILKKAKLGSVGVPQLVLELMQGGAGNE